MLMTSLLLYETFRLTKRWPVKTDDCYLIQIFPNVYFLILSYLATFEIFDFLWILSALSSWRLKWYFQFTWRLSVCPFACPPDRKLFTMVTSYQDPLRQFHQFKPNLTWSCIRYRKIDLFIKSRYVLLKGEIESLLKVCRYS